MSFESSKVIKKRNESKICCCSTFTIEKLLTMAASISNKIENLEIYSLIWLDASVNSSEENIKAQEQLRSSINHLLTFEVDHQCLDYIHSVSRDDRIVLIVSGSLGRVVVPQIVSFRQIISIYIYCRDKKGNEQWSQHFSKVKGVIVRLDELIQRIQADQIQRQRQKTDETLSISFVNAKVEGEGQSSTGLDGQCIHSHLLIECLIQMKSSVDERQELITFCKHQYKDSPTDLRIVHEFERDYLPNRSLWWYTRHSFLYRLLNKALRVQNVDILYLFRFFIRDLEQELNKNICSSPIRVYRAQQMSKEEIETLRRSVGQYVSMNSFLSTSVDRQSARSFLYSVDPSDDTEKVFFEIDADPRLENIKPFSNIRKISYFPSEEEVLFMIRSIFQIVEMKPDHDGIWNIRMVLCSENNHHLQLLFQHMKKELGTKEINLLEFGDVLLGMSKLNDAEKYYHHYLSRLSDDHPNVSACYHALGRVTAAKGDYASSLKWYDKSLEINIRTLESDHPSIANTHNYIGEVHRKNGDYTRALESYEKALIIYKKAYGGDDLHTAECLNNMGAAYQKQREYSKALEDYRKALAIEKIHLPPGHPYLGTTHNNIGNVHVCLQQCDQALGHLNLALKIKLNSLPSQHPDIAMTLQNIGIVHEIKGDFQQALIHFERAEKIYRHGLPPTHPDVIDIAKLIEHVSSKKK